MSAPELQIYQARQVYEEALHTWTYQHCIETLGLDQAEIYNRYRVVPAIHAKIRIANERLASILQPGLDLRDPAVLTDFVMAYLFFAAVFEGCWFFNGFSPIFALQRRGLMKGTAEQLQYIMRDEVLHSGFGIRVVRQILQEESLTLDPDALAAMWQQAEAAEIAYAGICCRSRSWATAPSCMSRSSATSPTDARTSCASPNPLPAPWRPCPGWTSRPTCARRRTSSRPG